MALRVISYLAPSIPAGLFHLAARAIREKTGIDVELRFNDRISGPLPGDENPFADGTADLGFVCSPTYRWLKDRLDLLAVPVPADARAADAPVYFGDVVVAAGSPFTAFKDLRGHAWAYNDRNSRSGWLGMLDRIAPLPPEGYFSNLVHAGSHLESLRLVGTRQVAAAAIDSNTLWNELKCKPGIRAELRVIESWGPFPIQPVVMRADIPARVRQSVRDALLHMHEPFGHELRSFGFVRFVFEGDAAYGP